MAQLFVSTAHLINCICAQWQADVLVLMLNDLIHETRGATYAIKVCIWHGELRGLDRHIEIRRLQLGGRCDKRLHNILHIAFSFMFHISEGRRATDMLHRYIRRGEPLDLSKSSTGLSRAVVTTSAFRAAECPGFS